MKWTKLRQYQFIDMDCGFVINFCGIFRKGAEQFDFIRCNLIQKSAYKVKYISQISGGLFFASSRLRFFKEFGTMGNKTVILFKCHRSIGNSIEFYLFILL